MRSSRVSSFVALSEVKGESLVVHARDAVKVVARQSTAAMFARFPIPRNANN